VSQPADQPAPPVGPVDCLVVSFPGSRFNGDIVPAIQELVDAGTVRILDVVVVHKSDDGEVAVVELNELESDEAAPFAGLDGEVDELLNDDDISELAALVAPGDSAALLLWENTWAAKTAAAIRAAHGEVVLHERLPADQVQAAWSSAFPA
jgi:uncharacterized membrane protein